MPRTSTVSIPPPPNAERDLLLRFLLPRPHVLTLFYLLTFTIFGQTALRDERFEGPLQRWL